MARYGTGEGRGTATIRTAVLTSIAVVCVVALAFTAVFIWSRAGADRQSASKPADYCTTTASSGTYPLTLTQTRNASHITAIAIGRGLQDHAATVAIATAMQESKLVNLDYGDLDSVGLFQQRPSQGWGTLEQLMDETYATNAFYDGLVKVANWQTIPVEDAAQAVQRSGYPDLYAQWDGMARAWASALTGEVAAGVTCSLHTRATADPDGLVSAFQSLFPSIGVARSPQSDDNGDGSASDTTLTFTLPAGLSETETRRRGWQAATWLVSHAQQYGVDAVHANGMDWTRGAGVWSGTEAAESTLTATLRR
ncbi:cobalt transporter [Bifidobacterium rousetti]|uniref:cobalt transporter n=1 Tax=Bifidobacterium rousetti TaxID=2045439 RepID=UPI001238C648|nr:cobalt transporter [Bifidobacterium rousetti]KAA8820581.1 cobalt transporter [Bifidobacterium rousetti]